MKFNNIKCFLLTTIIVLLLSTIISAINMNILNLLAAVKIGFIDILLVNY